MVLIHGLPTNFSVIRRICVGGDSRPRFSEAFCNTQKHFFTVIRSPVELPAFSFSKESCLQEALLSCTSLMQKCAKTKSLADGHLIHTHILSHGLEPDVFLATTLVNMYIQCGHISAAHQAFRKLLYPDLLTWNMMILAYAKDTSAEEAFKLFDQMQASGIEPNEFTYVGVFTASANLLHLEKGQEVHSQIVKIGIQLNVFMSNSLIDVYVNCGRINDACHVFSTMDTRDVVSWNTLIGGCTKHSSLERSFFYYGQMLVEGISPNEVTFLSLMNACAILGDFELGKQVHLELIACNINPSRLLNNTVIDMYSKCGSMRHAWQAFHSICVKDEVTWNAIIGGCARIGNADTVVRSFLRMKHEALCPNEITFLSVLHACATTGNLEQVRHVHACINQPWIKSNVVICSRFVDTYAKCGELDDARVLFNQSSKQNVVLWTVMIAAYGRHGDVDEAMRLFYQMELRGFNPNDVTFISILDACSSLGFLEEGHLVHIYIVEKGLKGSIPLDNALVNLYSKLGCLADACNVFDNINERDMVSYTSIIAGFSECELYEKALQVFQGMVQDGVKPDQVTFAAVNHACANLAALEQGRLIHFHFAYSGVVMDAFVANALIDMYSKCGSLVDAQCVVNRYAKKDIVSWNTMVSGFSQHAQVKELPMLIDHMEEEGVTLNHVSSLCLLSVCGRSGSVSEGLYLFSYLLEFLITPIMVEHYACMVDLLGRAGYLTEAIYFIQRMPFQPSATVWGALLGACKLHRLTELAENASREIIQLEPQNSAVFVVLSNMYAAV